MKGFFKIVIEILKQHGFHYIRQGKGSHEIWGNDKVQKPVPYNLYSRHTANSVLKQFGLKEKI